jgi:ABC-type branched-subunit amino acid transport system substrate-binding protein
MILVSKYKKLLTIIVVLLFYSIATYAENSEKIIRIAILDNFHFQPNITNEYDIYYSEGAEVAKFVAKKKGFKIEYKIFKFAREPLAILDIIPQVNSWNPDVIIGPRNSNMFITIKNSFKNILVLSPFASSSEIEKMPKNYYSLTLPDRYISDAISRYMDKHYAKNGIFSIVEADCKNCVDISHELGKIYKNNNTKKRFVENYYLQGSVKDLDIQKILKNYDSTDIIFLPNTSYSSAVLMVRITNYLKRPMVFIGADDWGSIRNSVVGKLKADFPYYGIRVTPWSLKSKSSLMNDFEKNYEEIYHTKPADAVSLLAYTTIISIVNAINKFPEPNIKNIKESILSSYMRALKSNKNWYRPSQFEFYKIDENSDVLIDRISVPL